MSVLLPHVGPVRISQHFELHENHYKDDLKPNFKDDLAFLKKHNSTSQRFRKSCRV